MQVTIKFLLNRIDFEKHIYRGHYPASFILVLKILVL